MKTHTIWLSITIILATVMGLLLNKVSTLKDQISQLENQAPTIEYVEVCDFNKLAPNYNLYDVLVSLDIPHPEIVLQQALLETGHFKAPYMMKCNNLFGIMNSNGTLAKYDHWIECVLAYKKYFSNKYKGGDYYQFLEDCNYAVPGYTDLLKKVNVEPYINSTIS